MDQSSPTASVPGTEMSDQEVIYSALIHLQSPLESPNRLRPGGNQRPGENDDKGCSVPWRPVAVTLGILCLLLLMIIIVLGTMIFQYIQEKHILQNLRQKNHIMQNDNFTQQLSTNKSLASDILENKTLQWIKKPVSTEENKCHRKKMILSKSTQNTEHWSCCGENCYLFTKEDKTWNECKQACQRCGLSLLKIDDEDELAFLQPQADKNIYWIGLSYNEGKSAWKWIGSGTPGINSSVMSTTPGRGQCAFLTSTRITAIECTKTYSCICEQSISLLLRHREEKRPKSAPCAGLLRPAYLLQLRPLPVGELKEDRLGFFSFGALLEALAYKTPICN